MFIDLLRSRRSIRHYQDRPVEKEKIDTLIEAALRSPSSRGFNPWEFVVVTDPKSIHDLSKAKPHGSSFLKHASLAVVVCADPEKSDVWVEDASISAIILHLTATDLGLGSCWIQIRKRMHDENITADAYVSGLLGLRKGLTVEAIVAIGYPTRGKDPHSAASLQQEKISFQTYGRRS